MPKIAATILDLDPTLVKQKDEEGNTPLHLAFDSRQADVVLVCLKQDLDLINLISEKEWKDLLDQPIWERDITKFASDLIEKCPALITFQPLRSRIGETPQIALESACKAGRTATAIALIEEDPTRLTLRDEEGQTPLHWACESGCLTLPLRLLEKNPTLLSAVDNDGRTALDWIDDTDLALAFINKDPTLLEAKDGEGETALVKTCLNSDNQKLVLGFSEKIGFAKLTPEDIQALLSFIFFNNKTFVLFRLIENFSLERLIPELKTFARGHQVLEENPSHEINNTEFAWLISKPDRQDRVSKFLSAAAPFLPVSMVVNIHKLLVFSRLMSLQQASIFKFFPESLSSKAVTDPSAVILPGQVTNSHILPCLSPQELLALSDLVGNRNRIHLFINLAVCLQLAIHQLSYQENSHTGPIKWLSDQLQIFLSALENGISPLHVKNTLLTGKHGGPQNEEGIFPKQMVNTQLALAGPQARQILKDLFQAVEEIQPVTQLLVSAPTLLIKKRSFHPR